VKRDQEEKMKLLLTGFEPFGGRSTNPSDQVARALGEQRFEQIDVTTASLPVDQHKSPAAALAAIDAERPDVVLCLGQSVRQSAITVERVAVNLLDYSIPDNAGNQAVDKPAVEGGPTAYFVTLPVRVILEAIRDAGVPAELSMSAGTFVCNQVLYCVLHHIAVKGLNARAGFIHVPSLPEQVVSDPGRPSMSLETTMKAVSAAIEVIAGHEADSGRPF
jgi:pyroglutamyl-peptidase